MSAPSSKSKRKIEDGDYVPEDESEDEGSDGSDWSDVDSEDMLEQSNDEKESSDEKKTHRKERREVWKKLSHPWMRLGFFLEAGNRFTIEEKNGFYVVRKNKSVGKNYLYNKRFLLEENGFYFSENRNRWQKPVSEGIHDLVSWRPKGFVYKTDGQNDLFDDFE